MSHLLDELFTDDDLDEQVKKDKQCRFTAMDLLARRDHSESELRQKLSQRGFSASKIEEVLTALINENYLDDQRFAIGYTNYRMRKGYGPSYIQGSLRDRGVASEKIEIAIASIEDETWLDQIYQVYQQKFRQSATSLNEKAKRVRFLAQRGFTLDSIYKVVNAKSDRNEHAIDGDE